MRGDEPAPGLDETDISGFPRMRGDEPILRFFPRANVWFSPHARG